MFYVLLNEGDVWLVIWSDRGYCANCVHEADNSNRDGTREARIDCSRIVTELELRCCSVITEGTNAMLKLWQIGLYLRVQLQW